MLFHSHPVPFDCPNCGPHPASPEWIFDHEEKIIGFIHWPCGYNEQYDQDDEEQPKKKQPTRWHDLEQLQQPPTM